MFFSVKFGDDEKALFNPDCAVQLLIDDIKKRCGCPKQVVIDLIDEHGDLVHISEHSTENGTPLFTNRGNYILLEVKKKDSEHIKYIPLLSGIAETYPEMLARLDALSNPNARVDGKNSRLRGTRAGTKLSSSQMPKRKVSGTLGENKSKSRLK
jgi:hypothetical protein